MKILALDIATHTGWALSNQIYGCWNFSILRDESDGMRLIRFKSKLTEIFKSEKPDIVVFERPGGQHVRAVIVESMLIGVMESLCEEWGVSYKGYSSAEIKKYATGKGNSNKEKMIQAAKDKLEYKGDNDNEADALWLWNLSNFNINK